MPRTLTRAAVLSLAALLGACASAPATHPTYPIDLGLPQVKGEVQAPLPPAVLAHLDGEPQQSGSAQP